MQVVYFLNTWKLVLEVIILWFFYYMLCIFIKGTRTVQVVKGFVILAVFYLLTQFLELNIINWILTKMLAISVLALLVIFHPELRRALARIGQFGMFVSEKETLDEIAKAALMLSKKKVGALIAVEREIGLKGYVESGVKLDSSVTSELINTIFMPNTPLHDGGVIIQSSRIVAAGCLFPLTQSPHVAKALGTRHRAAIGLSEETDAVVVVVSEETGGISIAINGRLTRNLDEKELAKTLSNMYRPKRTRRNIFAIWSRLASHKPAGS